MATEVDEEALSWKDAINRKKCLYVGLIFGAMVLVAGGAAVGVVLSRRESTTPGDTPEPTVEPTAGAPPQSILIGTPGPTVEPTPRPTLGSISIGSSEIDLNTTGLDLREFQKLDCGISQSVSDLTCVNAILLAKLI